MDGRKVYYSFHEMPMGYRDNYGGDYVTNAGRPGIKFSRIEATHMLIAMATLTLAFSFAFVPHPPLAHLTSAIKNIPFSFLAITTAFFCHETAHKYMGQKYGYWSEFRMFPQGLLFALFLAVTVGIVFAAPGAVQIWGSPNREESGKISAAGPLTNILLSILFILVGLSSGGAVAYIALFVAYINAFLAFFNLLPFGPMDGLKVFRWKKEVWGMLIIISIALFVMLLRMFNV
ncbi:MAG: hypothetical protein U9O96_02040 [Candidatus Thermoplasmatota archaeon]|nr:hypothetical protein [Candidatus Thermoplasmatota archaeon]